MKSFIQLLIAVSALGAAMACDTKHATVTKSFPQAVEECIVYLKINESRIPEYLGNTFPDDAETKCLVRCVLLNLNAWNDATGVQPPVLNQYFAPDAKDTCSAARTYECLANKKPSCPGQVDVCQYAYDSFLCYYHQYGNIIACPQYVPLTEIQTRQVAIDCMKMLRTPRSQLECYSAGTVSNTTETQCLYRCIDSRSGLLNSDNRPVPKLFYIRDHKNADPRYLTAEVQTCVDESFVTYCDPCLAVYQVHKLCLDNYGTSGFTSRAISDGAKDILAGA